MVISRLCTPTAPIVMMRSKEGLNPVVSQSRTTNLTASIGVLSSHDFSKQLKYRLKHSGFIAGSLTIASRRQIQEAAKWHEIRFATSAAHRNQAATAPLPNPPYPD